MEVSFQKYSPDFEIATDDMKSSHMCTANTSIVRLFTITRVRLVATDRVEEDSSSKSERLERSVNLSEEDMDLTPAATTNMSINGL